MNPGPIVALPILIDFRSGSECGEDNRILLEQISVCSVRSLRSDERRDGVSKQLEVFSSGTEFPKEIHGGNAAAATLLRFF